ncbi:hypothetical protein CDIK_2182, partial [Cucumispora dikerogammari]
MTEENLSYEIKSINYRQMANEFPLGSTYFDFSAFLYEFSLSAARKNVPFVIKRRNKEFLGLGCKHINCTFKVNLNYRAERNNCLIKVLNTFHIPQCNETNLSLKHVIKGSLQSQTLIENKPVTVINSIVAHTGIEVNYMTVYKAIESFSHQNKTKLDNSYSLLNSLIANLNQDLVSTSIQTEND